MVLWAGTACGLETRPLDQNVLGDSKPTRLICFIFILLRSLPPFPCLSSPPCGKEPFSAFWASSCCSQLCNLPLEMC